MTELTRRNALIAGAWSVPAVAFAIGVPAAAASLPPLPVNMEWPNYGGVLTRYRVAGVVTTAISTYDLTIAVDAYRFNLQVPGAFTSGVPIGSVLQLNLEPFSSNLPTAPPMVFSGYDTSYAPTFQATTGIGTSTLTMPVTDPIGAGRSRSVDPYTQYLPGDYGTSGLPQYFISATLLVPDYQPKSASGQIITAENGFPAGTIVAPPA